nr:hypothetical protein [uncultured Holophaga sp.]
MIRLSRWSLCLLATGALSAQTLPDALAMVPDAATSVLIFKGASETETRIQDLAQRFSGRSQPLIHWEQDYGIDPAAFKGGPALILEAKPKAPAKAKAKAGEEELPAEAPKAREVLLLPGGDFKALLKELKARAHQGLYSFRRNEETYYLARRSGFVLASRDLAWLRQVVDNREDRVLSEAQPHLAWIGAQDFVALKPGRALHEGLAPAPAKSGKEGAPTAQAVDGLLNQLKALVDEQASFLALSLSLPKDQGLRGSVRLFLKPGSKLPAGLPAMAGHPLQGLPAAPFAFAVGGPNLPGVNAWFQSLAVGMEGGSEKDLKARLALQEELQKQVRSSSWMLGLPSTWGSSWLSGGLAVVKVEKPEAYLETMGRVMAQQAGQRKAAKKAGGTPMPEPIFTPGILPEVPSALVSIPLLQEPADPGKTMIFRMIFGGTNLEMAMAKADEHTVVMVIGGADVLQTALKNYRTAPSTLERDPLIRATDALLPADEPWRFYLSPSGTRDLVQGVLGAFPILPKDKSIPAIAPVPPIGMGFRIQPASADLDLVLPQATLEALAQWGQDMSKLWPQKPAEASPAPEEAAPEAEEPMEPQPEEAPAEDPAQK